MITTPVVQAQPFDLSVARTYLAAAAAGTKIIFAGGFNGSRVLNTVDIYDVTTRSWSSGPYLSVPRRYLTGAAAGNKIVFAGGSTAIRYVRCLSCMV